MKVHVAFNDLIETHPLIALSKGSNFYNGEDTKKPDIRLDCYVKGKRNTSINLLLLLK